MTISETLEFALRLPEVAEQAHHGILSLRVGGRIFATVPDDTHLRVMVDESAIRAFVAARANPDSGHSTSRQDEQQPHRD